MKLFEFLEPPDPGRLFDPLDDPLELIRREHDRQSQVCDQLDELFNFLGLEPVADWASSLRRFLSEDLPRHIKDEEEDLFPVLTRRCAGHEGLELILAQLTSEHELDMGLVEPILRELETIVEAGAPSNPTRFLADVRAFVETQRRHLIWENRAVLPLAEARLTTEDKKALGRAMAARRSASSA